jgi:serine/threonine protein kinase
MTTSSAGCPDENALLRVALGTSDDAELSRVEAHVDTCDNCRRALAAVASEGSRTPWRAPSSLQSGEQVGRYTIEELLGVGGMGVVYAAKDPTLDRRVALKLLRDPEVEVSAARLRREAQSMAKLSHANVVPVFDLGEWNGRLFLAMELVEGTTLDAWRRRAPTRSQLLQALVEAGRGLAAAHAAGVVHRDFKPANVLIGRDGRARVTDFGLARPEATRLDVAGREDSTVTTAPSTGSRAALPDLTRTGALLGTLAYMAPEQLGGKVVDARSDQFAWCIAVVEALTGRRPFEGANAEGLAASIARGPRLEGVPRQLRGVLARGLAKEPGARYPSMEALLDAFESARRGWMSWSLGIASVGLVGVIAVAIAMVSVRTSSNAADAKQTPSVEPEKVASLEVDAGAISKEVPDAGANDAEPLASDQALKVEVGTKRQLWVPGLSRAAVGDDAIADVHPSGTNVIELVGKKVGKTAIIFTSGSESRRWEVEVTAAPSPAKKVERSQLKLVVGQQQVLDTDEISRLAIGDPAIADVKVIGDRQVMLVGLRAGKTTLIVWPVSGARKEFLVEVTAD